MTPDNQTTDNMTPDNQTTGIIGWIFCLALGAVAGYAAKSFAAPATKEADKRELDNIYDENEKLARRNKELQRSNEDLLAKLTDLQKKAKTDSDTHEDMVDDLDDARRDIQRLRKQNEALARDLAEYRNVCEAQSAELAKLRNAN